MAGQQGSFVPVPSAGSGRYRLAIQLKDAITVLVEKTGLSATQIDNLIAAGAEPQHLLLLADALQIQGGLRPNIFSAIAPANATDALLKGPEAKALIADLATSAEQPAKDGLLKFFTDATHSDLRQRTAAYRQLLLSKDNGKFDKATLERMANALNWASAFPKLASKTATWSHLELVFEGVDDYVRILSKNGDEVAIVVKNGSEEVFEISDDFFRAAPSNPATPITGITVKANTGEAIIGGGFFKNADGSGSIGFVEDVSSEILPIVRTGIRFC